MIILSGFALLFFDKSHAFCYLTYRNAVEGEDILSKNISKRFLTKWDIGILLFLILIGTMITAWIYRPSNASGNSVEIRQNGAVIKTLPLDKDTEETLTFENGASNTFYIRNKTVSMKAANCGDHTCIRTGEIAHPGESIVCLPHRLVLQIVTRGEKNAPETPDAIVH